MSEQPWGYDGLVGRVAAAISSPHLEPEQAVWPWGEQARRVVEVVILPLLADVQGLADELSPDEAAGLQAIIDRHLDPPART